MEFRIDGKDLASLQDHGKAFIGHASHLFLEISNAIVGTIADMYSTDETEIETDRGIRVLMKHNRHMYIALAVILVVLLYTILFQK